LYDTAAFVLPHILSPVDRLSHGASAPPRSGVSSPLEEGSEGFP
jgi:hypothetical protein